MGIRVRVRIVRRAHEFNDTHLKIISKNVKKVSDIISFSAFFPLRIKYNAINVKKNTCVSLLPGVFPNNSEN